MPRAKASSDPLIEAVVITDDPKPGTYRIEARRDGRYVVTPNGEEVAWRQAQIGNAFGVSVYPSNRKQEEAMRSAKIALESWRRKV